MGAMKKTWFLLWLFGTVLLAGGCLLPWERQIDPIYSITFGVQLFPALQDNGGAIMLGLAAAIGLLSFKPKKLVDRAEIWRLILSAILLFLSVLYFLRGVLHQIATGNVVSAHVLGIGLVMVFLGSILLLVFSILDMPKKSTKQGRRPQKKA